MPLLAVSSNNHYLCVPRYACQNVCHLVNEAAVPNCYLAVIVILFGFCYLDLLKIFEKLRGHCSTDKELSSKSAATKQK